MKRLLTRGALLLLLCVLLAVPALADAVTDSISVCIGYFGWTEDEYVEKAKFSWQALDDWYGGDDLWVGAYQVEPMLALEDYTEWDTSGFDFESYVDESLFSTGNRFHLFFGQASPEEAATSSAAKYVYKILVTFSGTPVLSSEESNLDLIVGSDHALHVTADAEDDALTDYVQQNLPYASSDPSVVSVDQYGKLHVNAEGDAVITASFGQSSVSVSVHVGSGGAVSTGENGTTAGEGMQDGSVQLVLPEKAAQRTWPVYAALALSLLLGFAFGLVRYRKLR